VPPAFALIPAARPVVRRLQRKSARSPLLCVGRPDLWPQETQHNRMTRRPVVRPPSKAIEQIQKKKKKGKKKKKKKQKFILTF